MPDETLILENTRLRRKVFELASRLKLAQEICWAAKKISDKLHYDRAMIVHCDVSTNDIDELRDAVEKRYLVEQSKAWKEEWEKKKKGLPNALDAR